MSEKQIKVTDRRMFTPEGELREPYKDAGLQETRADTSEGTTAPKPSQTAPSPAAPPSAAVTAPPASQATPAQEPEEPEELLESGATFQDLIGLLGQSASVYLAQSAQRLEKRGEMLEMARMHVDLLAILKQKTKGNLAAEEAALLDDALYQLRMAFVQQG